MSFSNIAAIGNLVSGVAVLVSLVLLYSQLRQLTAQVRQTDRYQQTLVKQARTSRFMEVNARLTDPEFADVYLRIMTNADDLTLADWSRFTAHARTIFQNGEDTFSQHRRGLLHQDDYEGFVMSLDATFRSPALRVAWMLVRKMFPAPYMTFVDKIVAGTSAVRLDRNALASWKQDMAAELAAADKLSPTVRSTAT
ncbi:MAG TPA: hypothetical protein VGI95_14725 [Caulobacteraceae bacterium]|jgi:hypothetical protein